MRLLSRVVGSPRQISSAITPGCKCRTLSTGPACPSMCAACSECRRDPVPWQLLHAIILYAWLRWSLHTTDVALHSHSAQIIIIFRLKYYPVLQFLENEPDTGHFWVSFWCQSIRIPSDQWYPDASGLKPRNLKCRKVYPLNFKGRKVYPPKF